MGDEQTCDETHRVDFDTLLENAAEKDVQIEVETGDETDYTITMNCASTSLACWQKVTGSIGLVIITLLIPFALTYMPEIGMTLTVGGLAGIYGGIINRYFGISEVLARVLEHV